MRPTHIPFCFAEFIFSMSACSHTLDWKGILLREWKGSQGHILTWWQMKSRVLTSVVKTALLFCQSLPKASFLQEARVLSSLVHWESLSNRLEITHLLSFILDEEASEKQQSHLFSSCTLDVCRHLPDLLDSGTCRLVQMWKRGLEIYISLSQLVPDLWDMKKKIREHWVKEKKRDLFFRPSAGMANYKTL